MTDFAATLADEQEDFAAVVAFTSPSLLGGDALLVSVPVVLRRDRVRLDDRYEIGVRLQSCVTGEASAFDGCWSIAEKAIAAAVAWVEDNDTHSALVWRLS